MMNAKRTRSGKITTPQLDIPEEGQLRLKEVLSCIIICGETEVKEMIMEGDSKLNVLEDIAEDPMYWIAENMAQLLMVSTEKLVQLWNSRVDNTRVIVNCHSGISRSVAVVLLFLLNEKVIEEEHLHDAINYMSTSDESSMMKEQRKRSLMQKTMESILIAAKHLNNKKRGDGDDAIDTRLICLEPLSKRKKIL